MSSFVKKMSFLVIVCAVLYSAFGFLIIPYLTNQQAQNIIASKFGAKTEIQKISYNPFTFELIVTGLNIPAADARAGSKSRLTFDKFSAKFAIFPLLKKEIRLKSAVLESAHGQLIIFKDGTTNWTMKEEKSKPELNPLSKWTLSIEHIQINTSSLNILNNTHNNPLELFLGPFSLSASDVSGSPDAKILISSLDISVGGKGHFRVRGELGLKPFSADVYLDVEEFPLRFLSDALSDKTSLRLKKGHIDLMGNLKYAQGNAVFNGTSEIHDFNLSKNEGDDPILTWKKLTLKDIKTQTKPLSVHVDKMDLVEPHLSLPMRSDGSMNYADFLKRNDKSPNDLLISKLIISNGTLDYLDQKIQPPFAGHVHNIEGIISPISSSLSQKIHIALTGDVEAHGKFQAHGNLIPGVRQPILDLALNIHNIDMTIFTPLSDHFVGYEIRKGELYLDGNYALVKNKFRGKNQVLLDQFTLGKKVVSEHSTSWLLKLALALMKDRNGQIHFQLPLEGDVTSPSFSLGSLIGKALKNVISNTTTSPFDSLKSLSGEGENLQTVFFEPGTSYLKKEEHAKIKKLAKILEERPDLALEIKGEYQNEDVQILKQKYISDKLEPLLKIHHGDKTAAMRSLAHSLSENERGLAADLEKRLIDTVGISENELKSLGLARGNVIMSMLSTNKFSKDRLYLLASTKSDDNISPHATLSVRSK